MLPDNVSDQHSQCDENEWKLDFWNMLSHCSEDAEEIVCNGNRTEWSPIRSVII